MGRAACIAVIVGLLAGCAATPSPWVLGERTNAPIGDILCKEDRPGVCD